MDADGNQEGARTAAVEERSMAHKALATKPTAEKGSARAETLLAAAD